LESAIIFLRITDYLTTRPMGLATLFSAGDCVAIWREHQRIFRVMIDAAGVQ
jgi:hypothetical protein